MTRYQADLLLLLVALIWGAAFVAQKEALAHVGSFTFIAARFGLSALLVLPLALREQRRAAVNGAEITPAHGRPLAMLCIAFTAAVILQQVGLEKTTVTNAGFLTGLYVLFVPVICLLFFRQKLSKFIFPAALLSVAGVFLLSGAKMTVLTSGDGLVLLCAIGFAAQVALIGRIMEKVRAPFRVCLLQYVAVFLVALAAAFIFEQPDIQGLMKAWLPILYAGAISGGIAYTLQVVAQQYTPASDCAVILSGEALFAALAGALLQGDRLSAAGAAGCALILAAIMLVEFGPYISKRRAA